jgi:hypothetical protein
LNFQPKLKSWFILTSSLLSWAKSGFIKQRAIIIKKNTLLRGFIFADLSISHRLPRDKGVGIGK